jgi:UDP-N-acetylglucosamine 1-carboxyvinyltransferase
VPELKRQVEHTVIPDRLEAGTFALAAAITRGEITLERVIPEHLHALLAKLREAGVQVHETEDTITVHATERPKPLDIRTMPYPGFPTDLQQPMCALLTLADGASKVLETIYENRTQHVPELQKMGADIVAEGRTILIRGVERLKGARVRATDLRGGAALVLAALAHTARPLSKRLRTSIAAYEQLRVKLQALGAQIQRARAVCLCSGARGRGGYRRPVSMFRLHAELGVDLGTSEPAGLPAGARDRAARAVGRRHLAATGRVLAVAKRRA